MESFKKFISSHKAVIIIIAVITAAAAAALIRNGRPRGDFGKSSSHIIAPAGASSSPKISDAPIADASAPAASASISPAPSVSLSPAPEESKTNNSVPDTHSAPANDDAEENLRYSLEEGMEIDPQTGTDKFLTEPVPAGVPVPAEPDEVQITDVEHMCVLSVSCFSLSENPELLKEEKRELVPPDGYILKPESVTFNEGESVFDVLLRTLRQRKIHMEFSDTPIYNSAYIEGINNIYEFDAGSQSGWIYRVNDRFPNYGCSRYMLHDGDTVEFMYTLDRGKSAGAYSE